MNKLSIVIPVYGCAPCLRELYRQLHEVLVKNNLNYEIIFVDDRSPDQAWKEIQELASKDVRIKGIRLSRNFGQHIAITAGLQAATGEKIVVMDCDLQDSPDVIPELLKKHAEGFDIVLARRIRNRNFIRMQISKLYFYLLRLLCGAIYDSSYGTLSLITRKVADAYLKVNDLERHYLFVLHWLGFKKGTIVFRHDSRFQGKSSYSLRALIRHALSGLLFQSPNFLVWIVIFGSTMAAIGFSLALFLIISYFFFHPPPGWTSIAVLTLTFGGLNLMIMGAIGLYIGKVFNQVKNRPLFVIDEKIN